jgi:glutaredoxin 3
MRVEIYGTKNCKYCEMAKTLVDLTEGVDYVYTDVTDLEERANMNLRLKSPARSVPQIFVDGKHVGGFNELQKVVLAFKGQQ